jgi:arylsulfatase A-like enzyme
LQGKAQNREPIYWHYPHYPNQGGRPGGAIRQGDYKLIEFYDTGEKELYNLKKDIGETNNLIKKEPKQAKELAEKLNNWRKSVKAKMPKANPSF